jgi:hypothetical protein
MNLEKYFTTSPTKIVELLNVGLKELERNKTPDPRAHSYYYDLLTRIVLYAKDQTVSSAEQKMACEVFAFEHFKTLDSDLDFIDLDLMYGIIDEVYSFMVDMMGTFHYSPEQVTQLLIASLAFLDETLEKSFLQKGIQVDLTFRSSGPNRNHLSTWQ